MSKKLMLVAIMIGLACVLALPVMVSATETALTVPDFEGEDPGLSTDSLPVTVARLINAALGVLGLVAVVIILIGGFKWMTAMGNEETVKKAKALLIQGVIGLVIIVTSYALASFVIEALNKTVS